MKTSFRGVTKIEDKRKWSSEQSISGKAVLPVVDGCNNTQRVLCFWPMIAFSLKNTWTYEPVVSRSAVSARWQPLQNRFPVCLSSFRKVRHNIKCHKLKKHPSNIALLVEHAPGKLARLAMFFLEPYPNSKHSVYIDPQPSKCRFRFFLANESAEFIQFSLSHFGWHWCFWQFTRILADSISNTLWIDLEYPCNWTIAAAFYIQSYGKKASFIGIAMMCWL